jgi:cytochrome c biogenesis protein CcmG/thiol:disulfide interchange protein DsbE
MNTQSRKTGRNFSHFIPLALIGVGLIVLGLVAVKLISDDGLSSTYTVIPSEVNYPAPDLTLNNLEGERVTISDFRNQILLINNWATWCPPCKAEMPTLSRYYKDHAEQGFMLLGIEAGDPKADVEKFAKDYKLSFPVLLDPNTKSLTLFHNDNLPSSYVIDRNGIVVLAWTGPINREMLEKYVTPLLEQ